MTIKFPFPKKRDSQEEMIDNIESCLKEKKNMLIHAPTGIGKTVSALYPAVKFASENNLTVFFLTPRHSQHTIAIETLKKIGDVKVTNIIGKRLFCNYLYDEMGSAEFHDLCNYLKKEGKCEHYNKTYKKGELTEEAKKKVDEITRGIFGSDEIRKKCDKFCAYEIACQAAKKSDVIIADYFHLFNPFVSASFLKKTEKNLENSIIIVDEAHQLPARARDIFSSKLSTYVLKNAIKEAKGVRNDVYLDIENISARIDELAKEKLDGRNEEHVKKEEIVAILNSVQPGFLDRLKEVSEFDKGAEQNTLSPEPENNFVDGTLIPSQKNKEEEEYSAKKKSFCSGLLNFFEVWLNVENNDDSARIIRKKDSKYGTQIEIKLSALLPSVITSEVINASYATILMSATLQPLEMYADLLGIKNYKTQSFKSVFPPENRLNIVAPIATTKYSQRNDAQYKKYADIITKVFNSAGGNTAVFFPSYYFSNQVVNYFSGGINTFIETQELTKNQKSDLLKNFINSKNGLLVGVQSGSFDQGIDFPNNVLKCVIIAGLGLANPDLETKSLINCYNKNYGKGMEYGYIYPAVQKVIQASGRAIRSEKDKAAIIYLDERFLWKNYRLAVGGEGFRASREPWKDIEKWNLGKG